MPFAKKFRAMMGLPLAGDTVGDFVVETIEVVDLGSDWRGYRYGVEMVLTGRGGKEGIRRTLAPLFAQRVTTFSGYGNSYELWFDRPDIESMGDRHYAVRVEGAGARTDLDSELERFVHHLETEGWLPPNELPTPVESYLQDYRSEVKRKVDRYRRRLRRERGSRS